MLKHLLLVLPQESWYCNCNYLIFPMNTIIENLSGLPNVAVLNPIHALILVIISLT